MTSSKKDEDVIRGGSGDQECSSNDGQGTSNKAAVAITSSETGRVASDGTAEDSERDHERSTIVRLSFIGAENAEGTIEETLRCAREEILKEQRKEQQQIDASNDSFSSQHTNASSSPGRSAPCSDVDPSEPVASLQPQHRQGSAILRSSMTATEDNTQQEALRLAHQELLKEESNSSFFTDSKHCHRHQLGTSDAASRCTSHEGAAQEGNVHIEHSSMHQHRAKKQHNHEPMPDAMVPPRQPGMYNVAIPLRGEITETTNMRSSQQRPEEENQADVEAPFLAGDAAAAAHHEEPRAVETRSGLPVAKAIEPPTETATAVELPPKESRPRFRPIRKTVKLVAVSGLLLIIVGVVLIVLLVDLNSSDTHDNGINATKPTPLLKEVPNYTVVSLQNPSSPQAKAYLWLEQDPNLQSYDDNRRWQRFVLAVLYYATNGDEWYESFHWLDYDAPECDWYLVPPIYAADMSACVNGTVRSILLNTRNLRGHLVPELSRLTDLEFFDCGNNKWTGTIPTELGLMTNLEHLNLLGDKLVDPSATDQVDVSLTGTLPSELGLMTKLTGLGIAFNYRLEGTLPDTLSELTALTGLYIFDTDVSGMSRRS